MKTAYKSVTLILLFGLFLLWGLVSPVTAQDELESSGYTWTTIDFPGAWRTEAFGINNAGQIVGHYQDVSGYHGFLFSDGNFTTIDFPGAKMHTSAWGINDAGQVVGTTYLGGGYHGFLFSNGSFTTIDFPAAKCTGACGVNDAGQVVGTYWDDDEYYYDTYHYHGFLFSNGSFTTIYFPGARLTTAYGINDAGQIVGTYSYWDDDYFVYHGFLFSNGSFTTIDFPGAMCTYAFEINNAGQVVGRYGDVSGGHGFLFSNGSFTTIDFPGARHTSARGINDAGQVVGCYGDVSDVVHGFVATPVEENPPILEIIDAKMISPNELGIGIKVKYPESCGEETPRKVKFRAVINGKYVEETFNITNYTVPGEVWGYKPGEANIMFDINGNLLPTTPLKINLADEEVDRFTENERFELVGVAYCEDGLLSEESKIEVEILLPVVILHGYIHPFGYPLPWWLGGGLFPYESAYKSLKNSLTGKGYDNEDRWEFYDIKRYRTLWDPSDFVYTNPWKATPETIKKDLDGLLSKVWEHNYASKVNFIGHSFGGLVARYYASVKSENVNKVITVGTPHKGATFFYEVTFPYADSKEELEDVLTIKEGPHAGELCILFWTVPIYDCLENGPDQPLFENTLNAEPASGVKYYSIFGYQYDTDEKLILEEEDSWYKIIGVKHRPGDGYILAESARAFGTPLPVSSSKHAYLLNNKEAQSKILAILSDKLSGSISFENSKTRWFKDTIEPSETTSHITSIDPGISKAIIGVSWQGSDLDLILYDPNGKEVNPELAATDPDIDFIEDENYEQYIILNPVPGNWTTEIRAIDVPDEGEEYIMVASLLTNQPPIANIDGPYIGNKGSLITFDASHSYDPDGTIVNYEWNFGDGNTTSTTEDIITHLYSLAGDYNVTLTVTDNDGATNSTSQVITIYPPIAIFDTGSGTYPSIFGTHNGTIKPNQTVTVSKLYTYSCAGTGGHTEFVRIYGNGIDVNGTWNGYQGDYHNITISPFVTLLKYHEYNYTIITGSYPQIHHNRTLTVPDGEITCSEFIDANGKKYDNWIPAIRLE